MPTPTTVTLLHYTAFEKPYGGYIYLRRSCSKVCFKRKLSGNNWQQNTSKCYYLLHTTVPAVVPYNTISILYGVQLPVSGVRIISRKKVRSRSQKNDNENDNCSKIPLIPPYRHLGPFPASETTTTRFAFTISIYHHQDIAI